LFIVPEKEDIASWLLYSDMAALEACATIRIPATFTTTAVQCIKSIKCSSPVASKINLKSLRQNMKVDTTKIDNKYYSQISMVSSHY